MDKNTESYDKLRHLPGEVHRLAKAMAALDGLSLIAWIAKMIITEAQRRKLISPPAPARRKGQAQR